MYRRILAIVVLVAGLAAFAAPASAGGWATVRLDKPPGDVWVEVPWTFGYMVKQHDSEPINLGHTWLTATHRESGEMITADGIQEGAVGHYSMTVTFPRSGEWKWSITPDMFAETSFETLRVLDGPNVSARAAAQAEMEAPHPAHIHSGTCATLGDVVFPLGDVGGGAVDGTPVASTPMGPDTAIPVNVSVTTVQADLNTIIDGGHAINVHESADAIGTYIACGDVGGDVMGSDLAIGLGELNESGHLGTAWLHDNGDGSTTVTVILVEGETEGGDAEATPAASTSAVEVEIVGGNFTPARIEITAGTTVNWTNKDDFAHTVTGDSLDFNDSSILDEGTTFSQTFDKPGTYSYRCGPHPYMLGTIVVT